MIKIRVTCPFRYIYDNDQAHVRKDLHFAAGDYYHLHPVKDKSEAKFILSPTFTFKNYIHVDAETVPEALGKEIGLEAGFHDTFTLPEEGTPLLTQTDDKGNFVGDEASYSDLDEVTVDPIKNQFDLTSDPAVVKSEPVVEEVDPLAEEKHQGALNTPDLPPVELPNDKIEDIESGGLGDRSNRENELDELHWQKVKDVAEGYGIEYTKKSEVIAKILKLEFGDPDEEIETNIKL